MRHRNMYYMTGLPGWMRFGFSPGWVGRSPTGLGPCASYLMTGQWPNPAMAAAWGMMQGGQMPMMGYGQMPFGAMGYDPMAYGGAWGGGPGGVPVGAADLRQAIAAQIAMLGQQIEMLRQQVAALQEQDE